MLEPGRGELRRAGLEVEVMRTQIASIVHVRRGRRQRSMWMIESANLFRTDPVGREGPSEFRTREPIREPLWNASGRPESPGRPSSA